METNIKKKEERKVVRKVIGTIVAGVTIYHLGKLMGTTTTLIAVEDKFGEEAADAIMDMVYKVY